MMVDFKLMIVKCSVMMVKWSSMMVKWVYDHELISPSLTSISPSLTSISPSLTSILPSLAWSKPSFAHITIIEKLHRLQWAHNKKVFPCNAIFSSSFIPLSFEFPLLFLDIFLQCWRPQIVLNEKEMGNLKYVCVLPLPSSPLSLASTFPLPNSS